MKTLLACLGLLGSAVFASAQIRPDYAARQLIIAFDENSEIPAAGAKTPTDLFQALGAVRIEELLPRAYLVSLREDASIGRAFSAVQAFDFGKPCRWSLSYVERNWIPPISHGEERPDYISRTFSFAVRAEVQTGESVAIGGLVIPGDFAHLVVVKVRGRSLTNFGVSGVLSNPKVQLFAGTQMLLENDDWTTLRDFEKQSARSVGGPPTDPHESMIYTMLDPDVAYSFIVSGASGDTGIAMLEVFVSDSFYTVAAPKGTGDGRYEKAPNKSPEPTPTAVTPRAKEMKTERKKSICESNEARGAPAAVVAHL